MERREFFKSVGISIGAMSLFGLPKKQDPDSEKANEIIVAWQHPAGGFLYFTHPACYCNIDFTDGRLSRD